MLQAGIGGGACGVPPEVQNLGPILLESKLSWSPPWQLLCCRIFCCLRSLAEEHVFQEVFGLTISILVQRSSILELTDL